MPRIVKTTKRIRRRSYSTRKGFSRRTAYGQRDTASNIIKVMCASKVSPAMYKKGFMVKPILQLVQSQMFKNFLQCYDQFRVSSVGVKITPQYTTDTAAMANYYYRWTRDGDHNIGFNNIVGNNGEASETATKMVDGYSPLYTMYSTNATGDRQMDYFAASVKNSQSTKQKFINVGATGSTSYMSIRASTATEKSRYANSYDVLNRLRDPLDSTVASARAFADIHRYLDEELDFYPTLSIVSDAPDISMNFILQITACVTFRGPGETRVVPAFTTDPNDPVTPPTPVNPT